MAEIGDTIGLDYFEKLEPEVREAVQHVRRDLQALSLDLRDRRRPRKGGLPELRERLTAHQPEFYDALDAETFEQLVLLADTWDVTEQIVAEKAAQRAAEHPDGKWSLDSLRLALIELKPSAYGHLDNTQLAAILRREGIPVVTIRIGGKTHKGVRKADVDRIFGDREARRKGVTRP